MNNNQPNQNPRQNNGSGNRPPRPPRQDGQARRPGAQGSGAPRGKSGAPKSKMVSTLKNSSRGAAIRAQRRNHDDANKLLSQYSDASAIRPEERPRANVIDNNPRLRVIGLGGMDGGGSKNMILVEYKNDAVVIDAGNDLGVDLPGINYGIADTAYLESIRHKMRAYIMTHGHLDHIGGLPHIVPRFPAPIYGSKFTIGRVEEIFQNFGLPMPDGFELHTVTMNEDTHERLKIGEFFLELVRVTHSIPGSTVVVLDTPVGRLINTGDFKFDPKPLDQELTDYDRLKELGNEGVLALLSESTTSDRPGRTPSESIIEPTIINIMDQAPGRIFVALFSTNMKRVQMIVNAAVHHNKKVAMDGRSMVSTLEMAVRHGFMKIPKGTFVPIASAASFKDDELVVVCTGSQGEPSSALQRMASGDHKHIKLKEQDTVILSSSPIPESGNDALIGKMVDGLVRKGVHVYEHRNAELDHIGPLHTSGHASWEEYAEMIAMTRPKFFVPIYGAYRSKQRHIDIAVEQGVPRKNCVNAENGEVIEFTPDQMEITGSVPVGTLLVDQTGALVSNIVVKDRVLLAEEGLVAVILTVDKKSGQLLTSPDIISRGFIYMRDSEELMNDFRVELRRAVAQRFKRVDLDRFKQEIREHVTHFLYEYTQRSPIVIPVVNIIGGKVEAKTVHANKAVQSPEDIAVQQQKRFEEMRAKLLGQDARTD